jgi:2-keto-3-deoxy-L-rhamnonate aldolase RhmA
MEGQTPLSVIGRLSAGETVLTLGVRQARTTDIARMARSAGYGVIWIDLEHSSMPIDTAVQIAATAQDLGLEAWVRTPERDYGVVGRVLDGGAGGIIAPRIETVAQAQAVVDAARFPPRGQRSQIALLPQNGFARVAPGQLNSMIDRMTVVQTLLESRRGIENADAIAAIDGVDLLAVGLNDLSADLGCLGDVQNSEMRAACRQVAAAAIRHGKLAVVGGAQDPAHYAALIDDGFAPLIFAGIDTDILCAGLNARVADWRTRLQAIRAAGNAHPDTHPESNS